MKNKPGKKIFGGLVPWKPTPLPPGPTLPQLPQPVPLKTLEPPHTDGLYCREIFEPITSRPIELEKFAADVVLQFRDLDGEHEIRTCCGDIYKVINALMDYAKILESVCDEWDLQPYHRAVYEIHAEKLRAIAKKYEAAIGYDYDAAVARCEAKKKRAASKDEDIGGDALDLAYKKSQQEAMKKASNKKKKG